MGEIIQFISIFTELVIAILGSLIAIKKKKVYGWGITITFAIYVFYDFVKLIGTSINASLLSILFLTATMSALWFVFNIYKEKKRK